MMEIVIGLQLGYVARLKQTWARVSKADAALFAELSEFTSTDGNYAEYRAQLQRAQPPILPYVALFLRDLVFIEDGNPLYVHDTAVNLGKLSKLAPIFNTFIQVRQNPYRFTEIPALQAYLHNITLPSEKLLRACSLSCETKDNLCL
eukprot:TRINITY_DN628_c0_g1_i2.p1 TRINITY_DN628_c0_g1~~TRINITY_DN628_c0_g1_i2.p1  ORF type:complete len:147 (-),score=60.55 TRINITY_DN628_c0_g1_i2:50-490(-)